MAKQGRTTVYNAITTDEKLREVNDENKQLEEDFLEYLSSADKSSGTIKQYKANLHIFWCWCVDYNKNKYFVDITKREAIKFQNFAINEWKWSPKRVRTFKATLRSLENYIIKILDDEYPNYKRIWSEIESPADEAVRTKSVLQMEDIQWLLGELVKKEQYMKACVLALAIFSGKRKAELTRFKVSYFDDENLICDGALYKTPEKMQTKGRGKRGKLLDVYTLAKPFKPYLDLWMQEREKLGIKSEWLFPKYSNGEWQDEHIEISTMDSFAKTFNTMLEKNGKVWYFHCARHFFTSYLLDQNLPENVVQALQGWASGDMVRIYDDRTNESQFEKYFGSEGIKQVEKKDLGDL
jgi:integrase